MSNLIRTVDKDGSVIQEESTNENKDINSPSKIHGDTHIKLLRLAVEEVMGLDNLSEKRRYAHKVDDLIDYVKTQTNNYTPNGFKAVLRELQLRLGSPPLAEKKINWLSRYAKLSSDKNEIDKELKTFDFYKSVQEKAIKAQKKHKAS